MEYVHSGLAATVPYARGSELLGLLLPNDGKRWRSGQRISSAFVESAVNQIIDKRMSKSQQMRWDPLCAHHLLQVRIRVIDGRLRNDFERWYPGIAANEPSSARVA
jgi:hypothetical protein